MVLDMGASEFAIESKGKTAAEAFRTATEEARWECGNAGYTGTIAEKSKFKMVTPRVGETTEQCIERCTEDPHHFSSDNAGPAGCIDLGPGEEPATRRFVFFGWASC